MVAIAHRPPRPSVRLAPLLSAALLASGALGITWWTWTWMKVDSLVTGHVADHGPLPSSAAERAALYSQGTGPEQQLSADLANINGLYPWGVGPLATAAALLLLGLFVARPTGRLAIAIGIAATALLLLMPIVLVGDSLGIALDILE